MSIRSICSPFLILSTLATARAQAIAEGYAATPSTLPVAAAMATAFAGGVAWFDGSDVMLHQDGQVPRSLLHFASPRFGSFLLHAGDELLLAEGSLDQVWALPLAIGGAPRLLTTIRFAYDSIALGTGRILVSARTGGFSAAFNDLIAVDLAAGTQTRIGLVGGASGPLALAQNGDLLYATAPTVFPPPAGSVEFVRWPAGQWAHALAGGPLLQRSNAQLVVAGIDSAADIALDDDGDLLFTDWLNGRVAECSDLFAAAAITTLLDYGTSSLSPVNVSFVRGAPAPFEPWTVAADCRLHVFETDYFAVAQQRWITPRPATLAAAPAGIIPTGGFLLVLQDGPAAGPLLFALSTLRTGIALPVSLAGFEQTPLWDTGLLFPVITDVQITSTTGVAAWQLQNPGFATGLDIHVQALFANASLDALGATAVATLQLGL